MPFLLIEGAEPIPGYRLVKKLGVGGYGEVWQATAPGDIPKAIKVIYGQSGDFRAAQELKALNRIKEVRHPFLLSLERVEILSNQVFIVMELAESSLMDRYDECRKLGYAGIPREELLQYIRDTTDALDYMNENYGLQHLDIKPQNLLLVAKRIKIGDFGLVKELCGTSVTATGGVTPVYASPESFDGKVSRYSDQYSLGVVYQEMLTGIRPFPGKTTLQLAFQHINSRPLLDPLPPNDRPVIARALAKIPDQRFPSCREMVDSLYSCARSRAPVTSRSPPPPIQKYREIDVDTASGEEEAARPFADHSILEMDTAASPDLPSDVFRPSARGQLFSRRSAPLESSETRKEISLRPTLFLGTGGLAGKTLRRVRNRLHLRFGNIGQVPIFRFLLLDTDRTRLRSAQLGFSGEVLTHEETLHVPLHRPVHYRNKSKELLGWLDRRWLYGIPRSQLTQGMRALGRLAMIDNADDILYRLRDVLTSMTSPEAVQTTSAETGMEVNIGPPRIFILAGISGGTGGGMVLDIAYAVRQIMGEMGLPAEGICGVLMHATGQKPTEGELARVNSYATLTELSHYARGDVPYMGDPVHGLAPFPMGESPFDDCYLVHLGEHLDDSQAQSATDVVAEYLYLNSATNTGPYLDQYRQATRAKPQEMVGLATVRTFQLSGLLFPRHFLADAAGRLFCRKLVTGWLGEDKEHSDERIKEEAVNQAAALGLEAEALTNQFHATAQKIWHSDPETYFQKIWTEWPQKPASPMQPVDPLEGIDLIKAKIREILGWRGGDAGASPPETAVDKAFREQAKALGEKLGQEVVEWLKIIFEDPAGRLKTSDRAAGFLQDYLAAVSESAKSLLSKYRIDQEDLCQRLKGQDKNVQGPGSWFGIGRRSVDDEMRSIFQELGWLGLKEFVLENIRAVLQAVSHKIFQFNQNLVLCRQKLTHFADFFKAGTSASQPSGGCPDIPGFQIILPPGCATLNEAAEMIVQNLPADFSLHFDLKFQAEILNAHGGLWEVVFKNSNIAEVLKEELESRARCAVGEVVKGVDSAEMFMQSQPDRNQVRLVLKNQQHAMLPTFPISGNGSHCVVVVPQTEAGATIREMLEKSLTPPPAMALESEGDVIVCIEKAHLPVYQIAASVIGNDPAYLDIAKQVLTRVDVNWRALPVG